MIPTTLREVLLDAVAKTRDLVELGYGGEIHLGAIVSVQEDYLWFQSHRRNVEAPGSRAAGPPTAVPLSAITSVLARAS